MRSLADLSPTDGSLPSRVLLSFLTTTALFGLYWVYGATVVRIIHVPAVRARAAQVAVKPRSDGPTLNQRMAQAHLPHEPWAADSKYQLRTDEALIYFEDFEPVEQNESPVESHNPQDTVLFTPFAMIWVPEGEEERDSAPVTIVSERAYVTFDTKFDIMSIKPGRIVRSGLDGEVLIEGPEGLMIKGRNIIFEKAAMHIRCDDEVQFAYRQHRGMAKRLQVELTADETNDRDDRLAITGVKSLRLRRDVAMDLVAEPSEETGDVTELKIRSAGSFEYVLDSHVATFEDNVRVYRPTGPDEYDLIQCDLLTLHFEPPAGEGSGGQAGAAEPVSATAPAPQNVGVTDPEITGANGGRQPSARNRLNLEFRRLQAQGDTVLLFSQANHLRARMNNLQYDRRNRVAVLSDPNYVEVTRSGTSELRSPEITLSHDEDGAIVRAWCRGAGRLEYFDDETRRLQLIADWGKQLLKYPDQKTGLDVIELDGQAAVWQPQQETGLAAETIWIWFDPSRDDGRTIVREPAVGERQERAVPAPRHLMARNNVEIISPEMVSHSQLFRAWFQPARSKPVPGAAPAGLVARDASTAAGGRDPAQPEESPANSDSWPPDESSAPPDERRNLRNPIDVVSDEVQALVEIGPDQGNANVAHVWTRGKVSVKQENGANQAPFLMNGHELHVWNRGEGDQLLEVFGQADNNRQQPAQIRDRGMQLEGKKIHFDRSGNVAGIEGPGKLELPVDRTLEGEPLDTPQRLIVHFRNRMTFDGETIRFFGSVRTTLRGGTSNSQVECRQMDVVLAQSIDFSQTPDRENVKVDRVVCEGHVRFQSEDRLEGQLKEIRRGEFSRLVLNQIARSMEAFGPNGWLTFWRHGREGQRAFAPQAVARANSPLRPSREEWEYINIKFRGTMTANRENRSSTFKDGVEVLYGPVNDSTEVVDRDQLPEEGGWMGCQELNVFQRRQSEESKPHVELLARENAELEGHTFTAQADEISYDGSKGRYLLRSDVSRVATIWRQTEVGGEFSRFDAQSWEFIPSQNIMKANQSKGLDAVQ